MNSLTPSRPALSCRFARVWIALAPAADPGREAWSKSAHVAGCADCQRYFRAQETLESALRHGAMNGRDAAPAGLDRRTMDAIARIAVEPPKITQRVPAFAVAAMAASVMLGLAFLSKSPDPRVNPVSVAEVPAARTSADADSLPGRFSLKPAAEALIKHEPLQQEAEAIYSDATTALRFLEVNFAPTPRPRENG